MGTHPHCLFLPFSESVNYRRKTVCAWCAWRPQGIATTILRLRRAIHLAIRSSDRNGCHDNSQTLLPFSQRNDVYLYTKVHEGDVSFLLQLTFGLFQQRHIYAVPNVKPNSRSHLR